MTLPRLILTTALLAALVAARPTSADDQKPGTGAKPVSTTDPNSSTTTAHLGNLSGEVVKVSDTSITLKVPEVVQSGVTRRHVGNHTIATPKLGVKPVEVTYSLAEKLVVKRIGGKESDLSAVKAGETVQIHVNKVKEGKLGEKAEVRFEVWRIDVPNATSNKK